MFRLDQVDGAKMGGGWVGGVTVQSAFLALNNVKAKAKVKYS